MNSVESRVAQNSRSSSSERNSGTGFIFVFGIGIPLPSIHVPNGDHAHKGSADRERHEQASPSAGVPKRVVSFFPPGVPDIAAHDQRLIEEDVLSLFRADSMPLPVLVCICFVPLKTATAIEGIAAFRHITEYISAIYTKQEGSDVRKRNSLDAAERVL
jgi:hypothetical protein